MPERSLVCTNPKPRELCHSSLSFTLVLFIHAHNKTLGEFLKRNRERKMKHPKRSKINDPFTDGTPGKPTYFAFSQGLRLLLNTWFLMIQINNFFKGGPLETKGCYL